VLTNNVGESLSVTRIGLAVLLSSWIPPILLYLRSVDYHRKRMVNLQPTNREGNSPLTSSCPSSFHVVIVLHPLVRVLFLHVLFLRVLLFLSCLDL